MGRNLRSRKRIRSEKPDEKKEHVTNQSIEMLNDDCLLHVFKYLPIYDRIRLQKVNKRWCAVSRMTWRTFRTMNFTSRLWGTDAMITTKVLKNILYLCGEYLRVWDMSDSEIGSESMEDPSVLQLCPNLTSVDFTSIFIKVNLISSLIENCSNITTLKLGHTSPLVNIWIKDGSILSTYTNLQVLNFEACYMCREAEYFFGSWIEFKNNDSVKELRFECCTGLYLSNLSSVVPELPNLHTLSLRGSLWRNPFDLDFIEQSSVQTLDISDNCHVITDDFLIQNSVAFDRLKSLILSNSYEVTDHGLGAVILSSNLEYLDIDNTAIDGSCLSNLPQLKELSCRGCSHLQVEHMQSFFNTSDKLEFIDLRESKKVDLVFKIMAAALKSTNSRRNGTELHMYVDETIGGFCDGLFTVSND